MTKQYEEKPNGCNVALKRWGVAFFVSMVLTFAGIAQFDTETGTILFTLGVLLGFIVIGIAIVVGFFTLLQGGP